VMGVVRTVLVTGGAGFVGSHLCAAWAAQPGVRVVSLDNYFTGSEANHVVGVEYVRGAAADIDALIDFEPDLVYHLGEYSRVEQSFADVSLVWEYNKLGIFAVLQFCRRVGAKLVYAGSSTKFGDGGLGRSQSPYAWTKASNTELVMNYGVWFGLRYAITYFYNVYGPREIATGKYATLIALFKHKYLMGEPLGVVLPGTQKRNFTHVDDIVSGLMLVGTEGEGDEFGMGAPESYSIAEIAGMFGAPISWLPERPGNRMSADVRTEKTEALGWKAHKRIEDDIQRFVQEHAFGSGASDVIN